MIKHYIKIARFDHWFKNIFMLPGIIMGLYYNNFSIESTSTGIILAGILATCLIALAGLIISSLISVQFLLTEAVFLIMGFLYNARPFRTKEKAYLDVLSESLNNPIRFILGWMLMGITIFPPSSILIAYWMGGAFLMATKRFAEYRFISNPDLARKYRQSFRYYTEEKLLISIFFYALCSSFFLAIFLIKHRIELLISFPFIAVLFAWYLNLGFEKGSIVQTPEKLYQKKGFVLYLLFLSVLMVVLLKIDIPELHWFIKNY
ncbi:hypothetical protein ES705_38567 [subsurface metagenome]